MDLTWVIYPLLFFTGFVDSIAGGGGVISLSAYLAVGLPPHMALGTNKFSAFLGTGLSAAVFARKGHIDWPVAAYSFLGALAGSAAGARLVLYIDDTALRVILICVIPLVAVCLLGKRDISVPSAVDHAMGKKIVYSLAIGFGLGCYDGFFGPGTGTFLILAFTLVMGIELLTACGVTKVVNFASNIAAVAMFVYSKNVDYNLGLPCAACVMAGSFIGTRLAIANGIRVVKPIMLFVLCGLLVKVAWDIFS